MVKKEVFEWIRTGQKNIELRRGKAKQGNNAVLSVEGIFSEKDIKRYLCSFYEAHEISTFPVR
jgi:hypothetical protein